MKEYLDQVGLWTCMSGTVLTVLIEVEKLAYCGWNPSLGLGPGLDNYREGTEY